jgi:hypothetical protein
VLCDFCSRSTTSGPPKKERGQTPRSSFTLFCDSLLLAV